MGENLTSVEVLVDPITHSMPDIPPRMAFENRAGATINNVIYACSGQNMAGQATGECMYLDLSQWTNRQWIGDMYKMTKPRSSACGVGAYGEFYVIGGRCRGQKIQKTVEIYNTEYLEWKDGIDMPTARAGHCAVRKVDEIIVVGGETEENRDDWMTMDIYNITEETWITVNLNGTDNRAYHACVLIGDEIYVTGGEGSDKSRGVLNTTLSINVSKKRPSVRIGPDMNYHRKFHGMSAHNGKPYAIGGKDCQDRNVDENETLDVEGWVWRRSGTFLKAARSNFGSVNVAQDLINPTG